MPYSVLIHGDSNTCVILLYYYDSENGCTSIPPKTEEYSTVPSPVRLKVG